MSPETYEKLAVVLRYLFALAGAFVALRAVYMALVDGRKAAAIRQSELKYGAVAMLTVLPADRHGKAQRLPIGRNGSVGSGHKSDIRIKGMGLRGRHFDYEIRACRMYVFSLREGDVQLVGRRASEGAPENIELNPGDRILAGKAAMSFSMLKTPRVTKSPMNSKVFKAKGRR